MVQLLLANGADVNQATTDNGETPLYAASSKGSAEVARLLLANGADAKQATLDGETPLGVAANSDNGEVVALLLREIV